MDWNELLADLENRFEAERRAGLAAQGAELAEAERGSVMLLDRLRAAVGREVRLGTRAGRCLSGRLLRVGKDVLLIEEGPGGQALVPLGALATAGPLPGPAPEVREVRRESLPGALRALARSGAPVRLLLTGAEITGRVVRVGGDHVDVLVDGPVPRGGSGGGVAGGAGRAVSVALGAVEVLRSR